jgi:hypothetical protein
MAATASWSQLQELLLRLLQIATSRRYQCSTIEKAALALSSISHKVENLGDRCHYNIHTILAQPRSQELLQAAISGDNRTVRDAAADVLSWLWTQVTAQPYGVAAVPSYAAALREAVFTIQHGSSCAAAGAAQLCWLASKQWPAADLLAPHAGGLMRAAAGLLEYQQGYEAGSRFFGEPLLHPSQIYCLAALCNITAHVPADELLEQQQQLLLPSLLRLWVVGDAAAGFLGPVLPPDLLFKVEAVVRGMLKAFSSFKLDCRLAAAARDALEHACQHLSEVVIHQVMYKIYSDSLRDSAGLSAKPAADAEADAEPAQATGEPCQVEQQVQRHVQQQQQQQQQNQVFHLLMSCAPNPHDFLQEVSGKPRYWDAFKDAHGIAPFKSFCWVWCQLLQQTPADIFEAVVSELLDILRGGSPSSHGNPAGAQDAEDAAAAATTAAAAVAESSDDAALAAAEAAAAAAAAAAAEAGEAEEAEVEATGEAEVSVCNVWCWCCNWDRRYDAAAADAASKGAGMRAAGDLLKYLHDA